MSNLILIDSEKSKPIGSIREGYDESFNCVSVELGE